MWAGDETRVSARREQQDESMAGFPREMAALVRQSNAGELAGRLALSSGDSSKRMFVEYMKSRSYAAVLTESERVMSADWAEVVCHAVKAAIGVKDANLCEAYTHQEASVEAFLRIFKTTTRQWLPILKQLLIDLRKLGDQVDRELRGQGKGTEACKLESAGRIMRKMLAQELRDEDPEDHEAPVSARGWRDSLLNLVFLEPLKVLAEQRPEGEREGEKDVEDGGAVDRDLEQAVRRLH